jgi:hypothetical protein
VCCGLAVVATGTECAGSDPLNYLHAGAAYRITDDARRTLQRGTLPTGTAEPAYDVDFGNAVRIPTVCSMTLSLPEAPDAAARWLVVEGGKPIALRATGSGGTWTAQVPEPAAEWTPSAGVVTTRAGS